MALGNLGERVRWIEDCGGTSELRPVKNWTYSWTELELELQNILQAAARNCRLSIIGLHLWYKLKFLEILKYHHLISDVRPLFSRKYFRKKKNTFLILPSDCYFHHVVLDTKHANVTGLSRSHTHNSHLYTVSCGANLFLMAAVIVSQQLISCGFIVWSVAGFKVYGQSERCKISY